jgi:hypothetical protein
MSSTQTRSSIITATALVALTVAAGSASARTDPGRPAPISTYDQINCPLERVDLQLVRCDNLTGNGATAQAWVPTR